MYPLSLFILVWFGLVWFYGISTIIGYLMLNPFLNALTVLFQTIQVSIQKQFHFKQFSLGLHSLNVKTILFKAIQFNISTQFSSIWPIDWTQLGATIQNQSKLGNDDNKGVLRFPQGSRISGTSLSDLFNVISWTNWRQGSYSSAEK